MNKIEYQVRFTTPAFLGNAEKEGQWRTPPFKALIRQWWRVAVAAQRKYDHGCMRQLEGDLLGNAWLEPVGGRARHRRSRVSIRLGDWRMGTVTSSDWPGGPMESVVTTADGKGPRADVYLGFGPVLPPSKKEGRGAISIRNAISPEQSVDFALRFPAEHASELEDVVQLMAWFGTLGSRCRNGWGSVRFDARNGTREIVSLPITGHALLQRVCREWTDCMALDWPHAIGRDSGGPLAWATPAFNDWRRSLGSLANIRVGVRRVAKAFFHQSGLGGVHLLGYPAGGKWTLEELKKGHPQRADQEGRLATQLRFKVCNTQAGLVGLVFHVPHRFPDALLWRLTDGQQQWLRGKEQEIWKAIHHALDTNSRLSRLQ